MRDLARAGLRPALAHLKMVDDPLGAHLAGHQAGPTRARPCARADEEGQAPADPDREHPGPAVTHMKLLFEPAHVFTITEPSDHPRDQT